MATLVSDVERVLGRVKAEPLARRVAERLRHAIYIGKLQPGEQLVELRIARQIGVGQSSVREALKELEHLGLVVKFPNRGTFVVKLSDEESRQFAYYRIQAMQGHTHWDMDRLVEKRGEILDRLEGRTRKSSGKIIDELRAIVLRGLSDGHEHVESGTEKRTRKMKK